MRGHTRKHPTEEQNSFCEISKISDYEKSVNWRNVAKEVFGDIPGTALNLRGLRKREGLTQAQLGKALGIEQSNISKMERGERPISSKIAKKIGELFRIDYHLFL